MPTRYMNSKFLSVILAAVLAVPGLVAGQAGHRNMQADGVWARRAAIMQGGSWSANSAVYAMLVNSGNAPDALVRAACEAAAKTEIHESYLEAGMMMMREVRKIDVPAGHKVEMKPGGYHLMLLGLKRDLKTGETIGVTLEFEKAGKIPVIATIR